MLRPVQELAAIIAMLHSSIRGRAQNGGHHPGDHNWLPLKILTVIRGMSESKYERVRERHRERERERETERCLVSPSVLVCDISLLPLCIGLVLEGVQVRRELAWQKRAETWLTLPEVAAGLYGRAPVSRHPSFKTPQ